MNLPNGKPKGKRSIMVIAEEVFGPFVSEGCTLSLIYETTLKVNYTPTTGTEAGIAFRKTLYQLGGLLLHQARTKGGVGNGAAKSVNIANIRRLLVVLGHGAINAGGQFYETRSM